MNLMDLLPPYYAVSAQVIDLQSAFEYWTEALKDARDDLFEQLFVDTSTWGLELWEAALGIKTDVTKSVAFRCTRVISKLRGLGTTTVEMIENVAESFINGDVEIIEHPELYSFDVKFVSVYGIPPNLEDLTAAIEEIKPAHLAFNYIYSYMTWAEHDGYNYTWDEWDAMSLTWDDFETYRE